MIEEQKHRQDRHRRDTAGGHVLSRSPRARPLAVVLACGLAVVVAFQVSLVAGAPWGAAAWGGSQPGQLPAGLRVASAFSAAFWLLGACQAR